MVSPSTGYVKQGGRPGDAHTTRRQDEDTRRAPRRVPLGAFQRRREREPERPEREIPTEKQRGGRIRELHSHDAGHARRVVALDAERVDPLLIGRDDRDDRARVDLRVRLRGRVAEQLLVRWKHQRVPLSRRWCRLMSSSRRWPPLPPPPGPGM